MINITLWPHYVEMNNTINYINCLEQLIPGRVQNCKLKYSFDILLDRHQFMSDSVSKVKSKTMILENNGETHFSFEKVFTIADAFE